MIFIDVSLMFDDLLQFSLIFIVFCRCCSIVLRFSLDIIDFY